MARLEPSQVRLSEQVSVARYRKFVEDQDRAALAAFIRDRFRERYLRPITSRGKHGFTMMSVACLMIETLEAFSQGWPNTRDKSFKAFKAFFNRHNSFADFRPIARRFWEDIRCGLLHQGEARGGWRIRRVGPLIDTASRILNATRFVNALAGTLEDYAKSLETEPWAAPVWTKFLRKMDAVCESSLG